MNNRKRILWPVGMGMLGMAGLFLLYFGIVSWAESPQHALDFFWQDRWIVIPIILGFGMQTGLYTILKKRLFIPVSQTGPSGALTGAGGPPPPWQWLPAARTTSRTFCLSLA